MNQSNGFAIHPILVKSLWLFGLVILVLAGCQTTPPVVSTIPCTIEVDGSAISVDVPAGNSVQQVLEKASIAFNQLDRVTPPSYTIITAPQKIVVVRIREAFEIEEVPIQFTQQKVDNESLPQGKTILVQPGTNGTLQITYRRLYEDNVEKSRVEVKRLTLVEPKPEIIMVGVQPQFISIPIQKKLAYIASGSAWIMQRTTAERKVLVNTGDLDGRIFSLSPDGKWLLFSRKSTQKPDIEINTLWIVSTTEESPKSIDLRIKNVIHFAEWAPAATYAIYYSTVEPRAAEPGWQANNDLQILTITPTGIPGRRDEIISSEAGGLYGWWGTSYFFSNDGKQLAYARPDSIGLVNLEKKTLVPLTGFLPYITRTNAVWVPSVAWSPDNKIIYFVTHIGTPENPSAESSPFFNLSTVFLSSKIQSSLVEKSGLYTFPVVSPLQLNKHYSVAYLKIVNAEQLENSRYRLEVMDRDGSNRREVFPPSGSSGMEGQKVIWSPPAADDLPQRIACLYQGNIYFLNPDKNQIQQVTGDGLVHRIDWK